MSQTPTRIAVITGASRGIGEQAARQLAQQGRHVVMLARSVDKLEAIRDEIRAAGGQASVYGCDIMDHQRLGELIESIAEEHKRLDILVNNAGMTRDNLMIRMSDEEFDTVVAANLRAVFVTCRAALRPMMRNRFGRIVNISSVAGVVGNMGQTNYAAAKSGVIGMTKSIAKEMAGKKITANVVAPGFIETAMTADLSDQVKKFALDATPLRRFGQADEVAGAIAYLTSDLAGYTTGQGVAVDGGRKIG